MKVKDGVACTTPSSTFRTISPLALLFELAFDRVAVALRAGPGRLALRLLGTGLTRLTTRLLRLLLGLPLLVPDLADLRRRCPERFRPGLDPLYVVRLVSVPEDRA